eukprot:s312_g17.t1
MMRQSMTCAMFHIRSRMVLAHTMALKELSAVLRREAGGNLTDFVRRARAEETRAEQRFRSTQRMDELERDLEQYRRDIRFAENRAQDLEGLQRVAAEKVQAALDRHKQAVENKEQSDAECKEAKSDIQQMKAQAEEAKKRLKKQNDKVKMLFSIICTIFFECPVPSVASGERHPVSLSHRGSLRSVLEDDGLADAPCRPESPSPFRDDFRALPAAGVAVIFFDFDGTLTATPGDRAARRTKQLELCERAAMLGPRLKSLRADGASLGIISKSTETWKMVRIFLDGVIVYGEKWS